jgi:hypothetical protein
MPIERETFEKVKQRKSTVLKFLYDHSNEAFTLSEIETSTGLQKLQVGIDDVLQELVGTGLTDCQEVNKVPYYAVTKKGMDFVQQSS